MLNVRELEQDIPPWPRGIFDVLKAGRIEHGSDVLDGSHKSLTTL